MKKVLIGLGIAVFVVGSILILSKSPNSNDILTKYGLDGLDKKKLVEKLENPEENNLEELGASISSNKIEFTDGNDTQTYEFKGDEFYISIAPYVNTTHG